MSSETIKAKNLKKKLKGYNYLIFEICTESGAFLVFLSDVWEIDKYALIVNQCVDYDNIS